jgi:hypothetical protein
MRWQIKRAAWPRNTRSTSRAAKLWIYYKSKLIKKRNRHQVSSLVDSDTRHQEKYSLFLIDVHSCSPSSEQPLQFVCREIFKFWTLLCLSVGIKISRLVTHTYCSATQRKIKLFDNLTLIGCPIRWPPHRENWRLTKVLSYSCVFWLYLSRGRRSKTLWLQLKRFHQSTIRKDRNWKHTQQQQIYENVQVSNI